MCRLPVNAGGEAAVRFSRNCGVQEGKFVVTVLCLHGEADRRLWLFRCCKQSSTLLRSRIVKLSSAYRFQMRGSYGLFFETLHVVVSNNSRDRTPHGCAPFCSLIDPLYWKYVDFDTKVGRSSIFAGVSFGVVCEAWVVLQFL